MELLFVMEQELVGFVVLSVMEQKLDIIVVSDGLRFRYKCC
jgi:hypothetical protein